MSVVGIDFGLQTCYMAIKHADGHIRVVENELGERNIVPYVTFTGRNRLIGTKDFAKKGNTISEWKRFIGLNYDDYEKQTESMLCNVERSGNSVKFKVDSRDQGFTTDQMTAMLFTKLKEIAEKYCNVTNLNCVISVPRYFTEQQKKVLWNASKIADLKCQLLKDTTAVALFYHMDQKLAAKRVTRNVVFIDMGALSLQVSAVSFSPDCNMVLAEEHNESVGGRYFDKKLADHFCAKEGEETKYDIRLLLPACEKLKRSMSRNSENIPLKPDLFQRQDQMNRAYFECLCEDLLNSVKKTFDDLRKRLGNHVEIHEVEMVGGSTRMPIIRRLAEKAFGRSPRSTLDTNEAVAMGCAHWCDLLLASGMNTQVYPQILECPNVMDDEAKEVANEEKEDKDRLRSPSQCSRGISEKNYRNWDGDEIIQKSELETQMKKEDKEEEDRQRKINEIMKCIHRIRQKSHTVPYSVNTIEQWLDGEGKDQEISVYREKLQELKELERRSNYENDTQAMNASQQSEALARQQLDKGIISTGNNNSGRPSTASKQPTKPTYKPTPKEGSEQVRPREKDEKPNDHERAAINQSSNQTSERAKQTQERVDNVTELAADTASKQTTKHTSEPTGQPQELERRFNYENSSGAMNARQHSEALGSMQRDKSIKSTGKNNSTASKQTYKQTQKQAPKEVGPWEKDSKPNDHKRAAINQSFNQTSKKAKQTQADTASKQTTKHTSKQTGQLFINSDHCIDMTPVVEVQERKRRKSWLSRCRGCNIL